MNLFKSRFAKLEAYAAAKPEDRTPEMLAEAQQEINAAALILVPMTETIKSGADLQTHIDTLETKVTTATEAATTAQNALKALKGERVLPTQKVTSDKGDGGDNMENAEEAKVVKKALQVAHEKPYTKRALSLLAED